jgi:cell wall assembly regulator SMI1
MNARESAEFHRIAQRWAELKSILGGLDPRTPDNLYPGADDATVDRLRALLAVPLPAELEALYRMNDGEGRLYESVEGIFEKFTLPFFTVPEPAAYNGISEYSFMRMEGLECAFGSISETLEQFAEAGGFSPEQRYPQIDDHDWMNHDGPVRKVLASPGWIPFANDATGNFLCVDVDPDQGGSVGQVIEVAYDDDRLRVLASSLADYLDTLVASASAGPEEGTMAASDRRIDRDFPHQIAILIPEGGFVAQLMALNLFCTRHAMPYNYKTRAAVPGRPHYFRFCFADAAHADAFMAEFGGERRSPAAAPGFPWREGPGDEA